ncbi:MAG TPA: hypothetical protein VFL57_15575, partial [Bryobacteraceae bacterium]|nr:hypothetical protein [Bryobacteraceae bacterium]
MLESGVQPGQRPEQQDEIRKAQAAFRSAAARLKPAAILDVSADSPAGPPLARVVYPETSVRPPALPVVRVHSAELYKAGQSTAAGPL